MIARTLIALLGLYRRFITTHLPSRCRFYPTCSHYAQQALTEHGAARGLCMTIVRIFKCHPLHSGGVDPVPKKRPEYLISEKELN